MTTTVFDTLAYSKKLKTAGFTEEQAELQGEVIAEIIDEKLATKKDLVELEERLTYKLSMRLGSMIVAAVPILAMLIKIGH